VDQVWGILPEPAAFAEGVEDQPDVALPQIPHPAMNQLGAAAGRAGPKVAPLQQQHAVPAGCRIDGDPAR
jgi:hypothetical protein